MLVSIEKAFDLMGVDVVQSFTENDTLENKTLNRFLRWKMFGRIKIKAIKTICWETSKPNYGKMKKQFKNNK